MPQANIEPWKIPNFMIRSGSSLEFKELLGLYICMLVWYFTLYKDLLVSIGAD